MLVKMIPMANSIVSGFNNVEFAKTSYEKIREELIEYERIKKNEEILKGIRRKELTFKRGLFIRNLTFAYNEQTKVFQEASIDIPVGFSIAVIGISGIGKTTFLDLILGLLTPQSGSILYDDYDIVTHMDQKGKCIGNIGSVACYIPQTVYLNGETIRNNVAFYINESDIDELKVEECLKCAQVWDDVMRMPDGLDTLIGENGISHVDLNYFITEGFTGDKKDICFSDEALLTFLREIEKEREETDIYETVTVQKMELGYDFQEMEYLKVDNVAKLVPCYRIYVLGKQKPYIINAYTNEMIREIKE